MKKRYNTPHRTCVVKTRLTEEEKKAFEEKCRALSLNQSEYLRQAVLCGKISATVKVTQRNAEMLDRISSLVAQYGKIGSNLNQIARYLNGGGGAFQGDGADKAAFRAEAAGRKRGAHF
ncbi:MAG: plasmid mobilization relaxosome protein MobC [Eubacteriales bacterium]|nr:plasmid mobilization relaxosome protein MobC [Eubacteriales bacterium]